MTKRRAQLSTRNQIVFDALVQIHNAAGLAITCVGSALPEGILDACTWIERNIAVVRENMTPQRKF